MSLVVFTKDPGNVVSFEDPSLPGRVSLRVEDWGGYGGFKAIFTRVMVAAQGNYQFLHTLGGSIYVYVFGDRIGQLSLSGLAFDATCEDSNEYLGIEHAIRYYNVERIANRKPPLKVTIGAATTLTAYLVAFQADLADPKTQIYQFSLQMMLVPPIKARRPERSTKSSSAKSGNKKFVSSNEPTVDSGDGGEGEDATGDFPSFAGFQGGNSGEDADGELLAAFDDGGAVSNPAASVPIGDVVGGFGS